MKEIVQKITDLFGKSLSSVMSSIAKAVTVMFTYLDNKLKHDQKKEAKEQKKQNMKTVDEVCDRGSLEDLLDIASKTFVITLSIAALATGCKAPDVIEVQPTKSWEGHYFTEQELAAATQDMKLEKGESVWVLSNKTLSRVLRETQQHSK